MPNHVHGIIVLVDDDIVGAGFKPTPTKPTPTKPAPTIAVTKRHGLPEIVRAFKSFSARRINAMRDTNGAPFWQRGFYEHIVRNERELDAIRRYILDNPLKWTLDRDNPENESG
jgi:putative transposase